MFEQGQLVDKTCLALAGQPSLARHAYITPIHMSPVPALNAACDAPLPQMQAFVVVGDSNGHVGLGVKCAKEVCCQSDGAHYAGCCHGLPASRSLSTTAEPMAILKIDNTAGGADLLPTSHCGVLS